MIDPPFFHLFTFHPLNFHLLLFKNPEEIFLPTLNYIQSQSPHPNFFFFFTFCNAPFLFYFLISNNFQCLQYVLYLVKLFFHLSIFSQGSIYMHFSTAQLLQRQIPLSSFPIILLLSAINCLLIGLSQIFLFPPKIRNYIHIMLLTSFCSPKDQSTRNF